MRRLRNCGWLILLWVALLSSRAERVVVHLRSGDRLTGTLLSETTNQVTLLTAWQQKITVPTAEIERRELVPAPTAPPATTPAARTAEPLFDQKTRQALERLLALYDANQITPVQYHEQRARLLGLPTAPPPPATNPAASPPGAPARPAQTAAQPGSPATKPAPPTQTQAPAKPAPAAKAPPKKAVKAKHPKRWKVNIQFGGTAVFNQSHTETYTTDAHYDYVYERFHQALAFQSLYSHANGVTAANRLYGSEKTELHLGDKKKVYLYNSADGLYDEIQRVDLLYHVGPGLGYELIKRPTFVLNPEAGLTYTETHPTDAPATTSLSLRLAQNATWHIAHRTTFTETLEFFPQRAKFHNYQVHLTATVSHALSSLLSLNVGLDDWYYSVPSPGALHNSFTVQSTLGITF